MARPPEWFRFIRNLAEDQQALIGEILDKQTEIMTNEAAGVYHKNHGLRTLHDLELRDLMSSAKTLGQKFLSVLEDNGNGAADIEQRVMGKNYRAKEG